MPDFIKINRLSEDDFNVIIEQAGGSRFSRDDSREKKLNADYVFDHVIVELKFIEEEGVEKETRQLKLASLFSKYDNSPVVVLDPLVLSHKARRGYFNIMEGPIKTHVKKASKQLKITSARIGKEISKLLIIVNNGYASLDQDEFKNIVAKCVQNDTTNIDFVISCGIYYYSDGFDSFVIAPFELQKIGEFEVLEEFDSINNAWNCFLNQHMTSFITEPDRKDDARMPILDIEFHVDDRIYIKPTPQFGKESDFFVAGRPRINSSGIEQCPLVAMTFPKLSRRSWDFISKIITDAWKLQGSYEKWVRFYLDEEKEYTNELQPLVPIVIDFNGISEKTKNGSLECFSDLCDFANDEFNTLVKDIILAARSIDETKVEIIQYIYLVTHVIGRDEKNDLSSIYVATGTEQPEITKVIIENKRVFFEWGLSLASAYAIKNGIEVVLYYKDTKYAWI